MKIDPEEIRFAHYHLLVNDSKCDIKDNVDVKQCELQMKSEIDKTHSMDYNNPTKHYYNL